MLLFSLSFNITVFVYTKNKQVIVFGCYIKDSIDIMEIKPCSICVSSGRKYVFDQTLSGRYSEYYRKQVSCDSLSDE
jgi:hypothetical protein